MIFVRNVKDITKNDVKIAGGKGASLGEMMRAGLPVPHGFVILASAYDKFLKEKKIPKNVAEEIKKAFKKLGAKKVAVRSSATAEDSKNAAWAGQLESYLNTTEKDLLKNVRRCWKSLSSPRAKFYRAEKRLNKTKISVAVVVQKMVKSEVSGVAFSVHPVTGDRNQIIIEAVYGLGEALVSGRVTPNSHLVEKDSLKVIDVHKEVKRKLSEAQIKKLAKLILEIEQHYGFPVDVEWAFAKGKFYIVQSRPITTLYNTAKNKSSKQSKLIDFAQKAKRQFSRDYASDTTLFCLYDSYKFAYPKYLGAKLSDVLIYKNRKNSGFYLLAGESAILEDLLEEKIKPKFVKKIIIEFSKRIEEIKGILAKEKISLKDSKKLFILNSELSPLERIIFLVPHLVLEHGIKMTDQKLVAYCQEARKNTENLFYAVDKFFGRQKTFVPKYVKGYKKNLREFIIFNNEVIGNQNSIKELNKILETGNESTEDKKAVKGFTAYAGKVRGTVKIVLSRKDYGKIKKGDILVAANTNPDYVSIIKKAAAIITDEGGLTCHAAIVAREMKIPCIVGTKVATQVLKTGDKVEVDAEEGIVRIIKKARRN